MLSGRELGEVLSRISALERKITGLYEHLNIAEPDLAASGASDEVMELLAAGNKLEAIKRLREQTSMSLNEAQVEIDRLEAGG